MIDLILAIKFLHVLFAAAMFGTWLGIAGFMLLAYRSGNPSVLYVAVVAAWLVSLRIEIRLRNMARQAALGRGTLADDYPRLFRIWFALAAFLLAAMIAIILLMVWQPRLD